MFLLVVSVITSKRCMLRLSSPEDPCITSDNKNNSLSTRPSAAYSAQCVHELYSHDWIFASRVPLFGRRSLNLKCREPFGTFVVVTMHLMLCVVMHSTTHSETDAVFLWFCNSGWAHRVVQLMTVGRLHGGFHYAKETSGAALLSPWKQFPNQTGFRSSVSAVRSPKKDVWFLILF